MRNVRLPYLATRPNEFLVGFLNHSVVELRADATYKDRGADRAG